MQRKRVLTSALITARASTGHARALQVSPGSIALKKFARVSCISGRCYKRARVKESATQTKNANAMRVGLATIARYNRVPTTALTVVFARTAHATVLAAILAMHAKWPRAPKTALITAFAKMGNVHANPSGEDSTAPFPLVRTSALAQALVWTLSANAIQGGRAPTALNVPVLLVVRAMESA